MEPSSASQAFATLGHPGRLAVFRLLMRFAPQGARPTEIAAALGMKRNTLSHHLADLTAARLARVDRRGRSLFYAVDLDMAEGLISYLALDVGRARPDLLTPLLAARRLPRGTAESNVLFICSANSARSILAEALLRDLGQGRFRAFSAGTAQVSTLNPFALAVLRRNGHAIDGLRPKTIRDFRGDGAPVMDFVLTVCDRAAAEDCPPWPGPPIAAHWGLPDPALTDGSNADKARVFARTYAALHARITAFVALPMARLTPMALQAAVDSIGHQEPSPDKR